MATNQIVEQPIYEVNNINAADFEAQISRIVKLQATIKRLLKEGYDYGKIQGCGKKPALLKPGAQKIQIAFGLEPDYEILKCTENFDGIGFFSYTMKCSFFSGGRKVAEGVGQANSKEVKWAYKWVSKKEVPTELNIEGLPSKELKGDYGLYTAYRIEENMNSKANTILKMAKKRALVDAALDVAGLSEVFTQDFNENLTPENPQEKVNAIKEQIKNGQQPDNTLTCTDCGKNIKEAEFDFSTKKYQKALCFSCQQKLKNTAGLPQAGEG